MKRLLATHIHSYNTWVRARKSALSWVSFVKRRGVLHSFIMKVISFVALGRKTVSLNGASLSFATDVVRLYKSNGTLGLVNYLKKCQLLLMQSLSDPKKTPPILRSSPRVSCTGGGLPRIIPLAHRKMIRKGDKMHIQLWLTLFQLHRVFTVKGKWKLETIYQPISSMVNCAISGEYLVLPGVRIEEYSSYYYPMYPYAFVDYMQQFINRLLKLIKRRKLDEVNWKWEPKTILSQGPNAYGRETSMVCIGKDALAWRDNPLRHILELFCRHTGMTQVTDLIFQASYMCVPEDVCRNDIKITLKEPRDPKTKRKRTINYKTVDPRDLDFEQIICNSPFIRWASNLLSKRIEALGKLSFKWEKGGKIRVFASVDFWTQSLLRPLHNWIFDVLRMIPQDATFDQGGRVRGFAEKCEKDSDVFSYDLSAATDRLPLTLQVELLGKLLKDPFLAVLWGLLLVGRPYFLKRRKNSDSIPKISTPYLKMKPVKSPSLLSYPLTQRFIPSEVLHALTRFDNLVTDSRKVVYTVGQPMGALTSWGMLALTHHFIVQMAAIRALPDKDNWFEEYLVLGDDIVIKGKPVANEYRRLMEQLQVPLNARKGLESTNGSFEFAKEFYYKCEQCSPFSFGEMRLASESLVGMIPLFLKERRMPRFKISHLARMHGFGYIVASRLNSGYLRLLRKHPRVVPLLLLATFPDTTPLSLNKFSDWMRSFNLNHLLPEDKISDILPFFIENFMSPVQGTLLFKTHFVTRDLVPYFSKQGKPTSDVIEKIIGEINISLAAKVKEFTPTLFGIEAETVPQTLDAVFDKLIEAYILMDSFAKWICPEVQEEVPGHIDKIGRWIKLKLQTLLYLKHRGKVPWDKIKLERR